IECDRNPPDVRLTDRSRLSQQGTNGNYRDDLEKDSLPGSGRFQRFVLRCGTSGCRPDKQQLADRMVFNPSDPDDQLFAVIVPADPLPTGDGGQRLAARLDDQVVRAEEPRPDSCRWWIENHQPALPSPNLKLAGQCRIDGMQSQISPVDL